MSKAILSTEGLLTSKDRKSSLITWVIAENKHQLRIDEEDTSPIFDSNEFLHLTENLMTNIDVVVLQDYNKGVLIYTTVNNYFLNEKKLKKFGQYRSECILTRDKI